MRDDAETVIGTSGLECPQCHFMNPPGALHCEKCSAALLADASQVITTGQMAGGWSMAAPVDPAAASSPGGLQPGSKLGGRYEILRLLGEGGMGAVYKARDTELDRLVAIKVIRPELAGNPEILQRFKQELILARQVTHKNVIRIFDLGQADGLKYITMEFVQGQDLKDLLRAKGKFDPMDAVKVIRQVCAALEAAHSEGVIHRDLKPQNIMVEESSGRILVMDFGIARSTEVSGLTRTGALMGTPEYMSPEQAKGEKVDPRSDLFTLGIIFYELITGKTPYKSETMMGTLLKRLREPAVPPVQQDPSIPPALSDIAMKCLAISADERYATARDVIRDLDAWRNRGTATLAADATTPGTMAATIAAAARSEATVAPAAPRRAALRWKWIGAGAAVAALAVAGFLLRDKFTSKPAGPQKPVSLLVADFNNVTGDPVFSGSLEPALITDLEGASFITSYDRGAARRIGAKLQPGATKLDEAVAKLVGLREGVQYIVVGSIDRQGSGYRLAGRAISVATGKSVLTLNVDASSKEGVLRAVGKMASRIRAALGDDTPEQLQLANLDTFTAGSMEAAQAYAAAKDFEVTGKREEAITSYLRAIDLDPNLGRAYSGLAVAYVNLRKQTQAEENFKKALALLDRMSEREKLRTLGIYYLSFIRNYEQASETYRKLVSQYPGDGAGYNNLAIAYAFTGRVPEALDAGRRAVEISPNILQRRLNLAIYQMFSGDFAGCIAETERILKENPAYEFAYLPLALSTLAKGDEKGAREIYGRLETKSPHGFSLAKIGEADLELYLGRNKAALQALQAGIASDERQKDTGEMALKHVARGEALLAAGQRAQAAAAASIAAGMNPLESVQFLAGRLLAGAGAEDKARLIASRLESMLQSQTKAYARLIRGEIALQKKQIPEAVDAFREAQKLHDSWWSHLLLGRAYTEAGHYAEALTELEVCRKRRGETGDLFYSDMTTLRYLPQLYYWLGRAQEGVGTADAARASFQEFLKIRQGTDPGDPLVADAKHRSGA